jgi:hypothetical protein
MADYPFVAVVRSSPEVFLSYKRLFQFLPTEIEQCIDKFDCIPEIIDIGIEYKVIVVFSWLGRYSTQINCAISNLPNVIYLLIGKYDVSPIPNDKIVVLKNGSINSKGLFQAFSTFKLL